MRTLTRVFFLVAIFALLMILWDRGLNLQEKVKTTGGSFTEGIVGAPRFINPVLAQTQSDKDLTELVFSRLLYIDSQQNITYLLAEDVSQSPDGTSYTLKLRPDLVFHDNEPVLADDVLFTIQKIQDPLIKSPLAQKWLGISATQIDNYTIEFQLDEPFSDFIYNLEIGILPKHIWENVSAQEFIFSTWNTQAIGSGSYEIKDIDYNENGVPRRYELKRAHNDAYINTIKIIFFENEEKLFKAFKSGDVNVVYGSFPEKATEFNTRNSHIYSQQLPRVFGIFFNQEKSQILAETAVRDAINDAIDIKRIQEELFHGYAVPIEDAIGTTRETTVQNLDTIQSNLDKAGWTKNSNGIRTKTIAGQERELTFSMSTLNFPEMLAVADYIQEDLAEVGINLEIQSFDQGDLNQGVIRPRNYEALLFGYEVQKFTDLFAFWHSSQINDPGLNISLFKNSSVDRSLEQLRAETTDYESVLEITETINETSPAVFLYSPSFTYITEKKLKTDNTLLHLKQAHDRFAMIDQWYKRTRHVWTGFIKNNEI